KALKENRLAEFLTEHGVDGTEQQFAELLNAKAGADHIITDKALMQVSGGVNAAYRKQDVIFREIWNYVQERKIMTDRDTSIVYKVLSFELVSRVLVHLIPYVDGVEQKMIHVDGEIFLNDLKSGKYGEFRAMHI
ncbi:MAG: hypothetical protein ACI4XA_01070, partial [Oscillospiraceae bacterium]